jgi:DNA invertase Pin-like site-specific DNA recombinase
VQYIEESTDRQDLELLTHIRESNMGIVIDSYKDVASGWLPGAPRPRYKHALVDLAAGRIDGIACLAVDRLTRRRDQVRPILNAMEQMGGRLFFLWDELDTASDDPDTELKLHTLVARAEQEAERTSRRYKLVAQHRAMQHKISGGGTRPFGHTLDWFALVPHEAEAIRDAAKRILAGEGVYSIVKEWNTETLAPKPVKAERWTTQVLSGILLSPRLIAKRDYGPELIDLDDVPPILDTETYERVCARLAEPKPHTGSAHTHRLLSGIAQCGRCNVPLRGGRNMPSRGGKPLYACPPKSRVEGSCGSLSVNSDPVDEIVSKRVVEWLSDKGNVSNLIALHAPGPQTEALTLRIAEINEALVDLSYLLAKRKIRATEYESRWDELVAERADKQRQVGNTREAHLLVEALSFEDVAAEWASRSLQWRRSILRLATRCIVVEPVGKTAGATSKGFRFDPERVAVTFADA